jgi:VWFA-related protein
VIARLLSSALVLLVAIGAPIAGQRAGQQPPPSKSDDPTAQPRFRAGTNFVRVDVYPTVNGAALGDLTANDFEVFEDGAPQKIETFEYVNVRATGSEEARHEPNSVAESQSMAETTRGRLFVIFLDTYFVDYAGSHRMQRTLVNLLNRVVGPEDMYAVMTPEMSAADITFARRTETLEGYLSKYWFWGQRDRLFPDDPVEQSYLECYPDTDGRHVAREMILRRRERRVIDALTDLSVHLRGVREERKAVIAITGGWVLFRENQALTGTGRAGVPRTGITPTGQLTPDTSAANLGYSRNNCERDRMNLSMLDDWKAFHDLFDLANRSNVSFYPVNALGLAATDTSMQPREQDSEPVLGERQAVWPAGGGTRDDTALVTARSENLIALAKNTDGVAVVYTNDLDKGLKRVVDDLTSYYLLGYASTNAKLDGKFRKITVKVTRPGVDVRARRGYLAPTPKEVEAGGMVEAPPESAAPPSSVQVALNALASARPGVPMRMALSYATLGPGGDGGTKLHAWTLVDLDTAVARQGEWLGGGTVEVALTAADGTALSSKLETLKPGEHAAAVDLGEIDVPRGELVIRVHVKPHGDGLPYSDTLRLSQVDGPGRPLVLRRGPTTGIRYVPTADMQFQRTERVRVDLPVQAGSLAPTAEVLDRVGHLIQVPVRTAVRTENGLTWASAELSLAPLAAGDYVIRMKAELNGKAQEVITGFRLVP